ncbi:metal-dependent transcriptional regulator [Granulicella arctica]|uniref:Transcriptional regulator MntR n=1 Tax=Granulicella arctica TaxID=940613 RepID=A0A7Y9PEH3_9BACT|nr:metal-dependent transcriptional regulator [Granulicella arctica]NYF78425.1 DtxR family Mn-dependent transcriptional regulator [Granulicella arctica]
MPKTKVKSKAKPSRSSEASKAGSEAVDDYLKTIFQLSGREERQVASTEIAVQLAISGASATNMLQKLAATEPPMVLYRKHHGVKLARAGRKRALEIIRHHRLLETFLHQVLDYPWDEVHQEAERLEHFISERFEERIAAKLGHPEFDPHGHAIPALDGSLPGQDLQSLAQLGPGQSAKVVSVSDKDPAMLRYLAAQGIRPGVRLTLGEQLPFKGSWQIRIGRSTTPTLLSDSLAAAILVART